MKKILKTSSKTSTILKTAKQIGYLTALVIIIGSTIGAGIFFKNESVLESTGNNFLFSILSWIIAAFGVVNLGLALVEVVSGQKGNASIIGWAKTFTKPWFHSFSRGFMLLIFYPLLMFAIGIYITQAISDAWNVKFEWWQVLFISFGFFSWFLFMSYFSLRSSAAIQWVLTVLKFIPILMVPILGFINVDSKNFSAVNSSPEGVNGLSPALGMIAAIPAIYFAFDGFYTVTSLKSNLKNPKKMGAILAVGIAIITGVYILLSTSLFGSSKDGTVNGMEISHEVKVVIKSFIVFAVIGVLNGYSLGTHRVYAEEFQNSDYKLAKMKIWKLNSGFIILYATSVFYLIVFGLIGSFGYDSASFSFSSDAIAKIPNDKYRYTYNLNKFIDVITNWISLIAFFIIATSILGALINRFTKKVKIDHQIKFFPLFAIISIILVYIPAIYIVITPLLNLAGVNVNLSGNELAGWNKTNIVTFFTLVGTILISLTPLIFEKTYKYIKRRRNSSISI